MAEALHPSELEIVIETPRFSLIKRRDDGRIDYVSPLPCPFNYGSVPGTRSSDGDRLDALLLGPRRARGSVVRAEVRALVHFVDAGERDPKYVCSRVPMTEGEALQVQLFFVCYAKLKGALNRLRGRSGETAYLELERL